MAESNAHHGSYGGLLRIRGFPPLLAAAGLGAANDNLYKMVVSLIAVNMGAAAGDTDYLALAGVLFVLPYLLFSGYAGWLADAFSKRTVLIATKSCEILTMIAAFGALASGNLDIMLAVIFLTAMQAAFFSPAHYGILPELLPESELSRANGLDELCMFLSIIIGSVAGAVLYDVWQGHVQLVALVLIAVAVLGTVASLGIGRVPAPSTPRRFNPFPWTEVLHGLRVLAKNRPLRLTVLGITYFWFLGALLQLGVILFGQEALGLTGAMNGLLQPAIAIGVGLGSVVAGRLSGDKVELGLVPLGSIGIGISALLLAWSPPSFSLAFAALIALGFFGGLFVVPLNANLQQRAPADERGRLIGTMNFLNMLGVAAASGALWLFSSPQALNLPADDMVLAIGLITFVVTVYVLWLLSDFAIRLSLLLLTHSVYRIRVVGTENLPRRGPALLVCNHVSFVDGLLVASCLQRFVRFIMYHRYYRMPGLHWILKQMHAIPIGENPKLIKDALKKARAELEAGHVVCIFAEGSLSRTGNALPFRRGVEKILAGIDVPVIPVHLDRVWGSIFSFKNGRFFFKWPERVPLPVTVSFGKAMPATTTAWRMRQAILELGSEAFRHRRTRNDLLHVRFLRAARRHWHKAAVADSTGAQLRYWQTLVGSLAFSDWFKRERASDKMIGVMLPASVAGVLVNIAALFAGKVPVNLNFTAGAEATQSALTQCGIGTIVTSRRFIEKAKIAERPGMVFVEDIAASITFLRKAALATICYLLPSGLVAKLLGLRTQQPDDVATVLFSSGSTGVPKGVLLSHHNLLSNVEGVAQVLWIAPEDKMMGVLPFFHAFGLTGCLWVPLLSGIGAVYHANPLDAKTIGKLVAEHGATILISTPTFCQSYLRACEPAQLATIRHTLVGAERLPASLAAAFQEKFGITLLEGYGATEMGPVVAVNTADVEHGAVKQTGHKPGTVGHPIPGVVAEVLDIETGEVLPPEREGMLLVKGPGRMLGYLNNPEKTAEVLRDGWYVTGDVAALDDEGFIRITDRLARFSKIGGEMVPHAKVEELLAGLPGVDGCVVTAVADAQKGERLVALYTSANAAAPAALWQRLSASDLPRLWLPKAQNLYCVESLPLLATGKLDLRRAKQLAQSLVEGAAA
jgi:acyl-[acyl-carrier-protein]-phospholipid O-acyltransferase/long-chain-fatty-acid--[acyl-carrier-protein] ligase